MVPLLMRKDGIGFVPTMARPFIALMPKAI
jgi:hypothetical protein